MTAARNDLETTQQSLAAGKSTHARAGYRPLAHTDTSYTGDPLVCPNATAKFQPDHTDQRLIAFKGVQMTAMAGGEATSPSS